MTDTWESSALIEEVWESSTVAGQTFTTVLREGESTGGGGTTMPSGTAGQVPQVSSGSTYELKTPNTANGLVRLNGSATIPDILHPSSITRDEEVPALASAVEVSLVVGVGPLMLASTAVDGSATTVSIIAPLPGNPASGNVPEGYNLVMTVPLAVADGVPPDGSILCVPAGTGVGVYRWRTGQMDEPWEEVSCPVGRQAYYYVEVDEFLWLATRTPTEFTQDLFSVDGASLNLDAGDIATVSPSGLDFGLSTVDGVLENHEGILDTERWVCAYFDTTNVTIGDYDGPSDVVTQPTPDGGIIVEGADVLLLAQTDPTENGLYEIASPSGIWTKLNYPDILIGNSFMVMCNAEGDPADGTHFEWIDEDPKIRQRRSFAHPGSSNGFADGRNGRWIKYAPALDVGTTAGTVAAGDDARFRQVVGGQDEGPIVNTISAATLLDATVTLTGAAGDHFRVSGGGRYYNNHSGNTHSPTLTFKLGGSTVATTTSIAALSASGTDRLFRFSVDIRVQGATDLNLVGDGQIGSSLLTVFAGTSSGDVGAGLSFDVHGNIQTGGNQEIQLTMLTIERVRA